MSDRSFRLLVNPLSGGGAAPAAVVAGGPAAPRRRRPVEVTYSPGPVACARAGRARRPPAATWSSRSAATGCSRRSPARSSTPGACSGIVPSGRGNDFARMLGLRHDPEDVAHVLLEGEPTTVDVIDAGRPDRARQRLRRRRLARLRDRRPVAPAAPVAAVPLRRGPLRARLHARPVHRRGRRRAARARRPTPSWSRTPATTAPACTSRPTPSLDRRAARRGRGPGRLEAAADPVDAEAVRRHRTSTSTTCIVLAGQRDPGQQRRPASRRTATASGSRRCRSPPRSAPSALRVLRLTAGRRSPRGAARPAPRRRRRRRRGRRSPVNRAASPSSSRPAPSRSAAPRATKTCSRGASGSVTDPPGASRATCSAAPRRVDRHRGVEAGDPRGQRQSARAGVDRRAGRTTGAVPGSSGSTHICTNRVGSVAAGASLRSLCSTPLPALSRCTRPGPTTPALPVGVLVHQARRRAPR